ncbi:MAG: hypothetical protein ACRD98_12140 [Nitrososphaera sp.]
MLSVAIRYGDALHPHASHDVAMPPVQSEFVHDQAAYGFRIEALRRGPTGVCRSY